MNTPLTHEAVIIQERKVLRHYARRQYRDYHLFSVVQVHEHESFEELWEGTLDAPTMREDDDFYIEELDMTVRIKRVERSSYNKYRYFTRVPELITDEKTEVTLAEATKQVEEYNEKVREQRAKHNQERLEEQLKNRKWYERLRDYFRKY